MQVVGNGRCRGGGEYSEPSVVLIVPLVWTEDYRTLWQLLM